MTIKSRFLFSFGANTARALVSLLSGLLVARNLGPADYGNLAYLIGSFWAIRAFLDMGASSAFYTFIAQRHRGRLYYLVYFGWLGFQFVLSSALVAVLLPTSVIERFWLGQEREIVFLALLSSFLQNQVWQTVVQIYEAKRRTIWIQAVSLAIVIVHLTLILLMLVAEWLAIPTVLWAITIEYLVAAGWLSFESHRIINKESGGHLEQDGSPLRKVVAEYLNYCKPMLVIAVLTSCYEMTDRWLLQRYGGASQQGFFQVASQLSTISLLATTSISNVLWKEVAEACERGAHATVIALYQKTSRMLVVLSATIACFFVPWAERLVIVLLGNEYHDAWPVLLVMLLYPIHQAMGQINGILFMATGRTRSFMNVTTAALLVGLPCSYVLLTPPPFGLEMGALGMAIKIVVLNLVFVNVQSWMIARHYNADYQWRHQVAIILGFLGMSFMAQLVVSTLLPYILGELGNGLLDTFIEVSCAGIIYMAGLLALIVFVPNVAGVGGAELMAIVRRFFTTRREVP